LTLSGQANAQIEAGLLTLRGQFRADQAQFVLPDETTPSLGQDVVVRLKRAAPANPNQVPLRTDLALQIDLGPQFEVRGQGLQTRLGGELTVTSPPRSDTFQVVGEVRAINGTYRAYGQPLRIEDGVLRFSGPYDDPALEVLALRGKGTPGNNARNLTGNTFDNQQVGVQITGSARTPRVALYANPDLPDSEKLAWLVLGRPTSGAGAETAVLQQAALALLSGQNGRGMDAGLATALGLDDIGLRGDTAQRSDGSVGQTTAITLGKRLSNNLYVAYEQSLNTALGAVNVFYDVSRHLTVRAQAGHESALDLIFTLQRD
jgi:translocation and assembly module TamB